MDDYELSFRLKDGMYYILEHGLDHQKEVINELVEIVVDEIKAKQERERKATDSVQHAIDIKNRTRAAKAARKKRGIDNDSPFLTAISNLSEIKETIQRTKELTDQLRAEIYLVQSKLKNKNGNGK